MTTRIHEQFYYENPELPNVMVPPQHTYVAATFFQGEDIRHSFFLPEAYRDNAAWALSVAVKSSIHAQNALWEGELLNGIYVGDSDTVEIVIPPDVTNDWLASTYWLSLLVQSKNVQDKKNAFRKVLFQIPFTIEYSTHSNPNILPDPTLHTRPNRVSYLSH